VRVNSAAPLSKFARVGSGLLSKLMDVAVIENLVSRTGFEKRKPLFLLATSWTELVSQKRSFVRRPIELLQDKVRRRQTAHACQRNRKLSRRIRICVPIKHPVETVKVQVARVGKNT
jgi:hypothetical protein